MYKLTVLSALTLLLASPFARAETDSSDDLRYCLDLPSVQQIAKCAGEVSAGNKGRTYSKEEVDKILSEEHATTPASTNDSPGSPATIGDKADKESSPERTGSNSN